MTASRDMFLAVLRRAALLLVVMCTGETAGAQPAVDPAPVVPSTVTAGNPQPLTMTIPGVLAIPSNPRDVVVTVGTLKAEVQRVAGRRITFQSPAFVFGLGERDVAAFDSAGNELGRGRIQYVSATAGFDGVGVWILFVLAVLPLGMLWYDIHKAYKFADSTRGAIIERTSSDGLTLEELRLVLAELAASPPGIPGLARTMMAIMLMLMVAGALFYVLSSGVGEVPSVVDKTLTVVTTALTTVIAFYFGARTAETAAAGSVPLGAVDTAGGPRSSGAITSITPSTGPAGTVISIAGRDFGVNPGRVSFGLVPAAPAAWGDTLVTVPVPAGLAAGQAVAIEVLPQGAVKVVSSAPRLFTP